MLPATSSEWIVFISVTLLLTIIATAFWEFAIRSALLTVTNKVFSGLMSVMHDAERRMYRDRHLLQPEATGATVEVTKQLKPLV